MKTFRGKELDRRVNTDDKFEREGEEIGVEEGHGVIVWQSGIDVGHGADDTRYDPLQQVEGREQQEERPIGDGTIVTEIVIEFLNRFTSRHLFFLYDLPHIYKKYLASYWY